MGAWQSLVKRAGLTLAAAFLLIPGAAMAQKKVPAPKVDRFEAAFNRAYDAAEAGEYEKARADYKISCDGKYIKACLNLGMLYDEGKGGPVDDATAVLYYRKGCDGKDFKACNTLGWMYSEGEGIGKDVAEALRLFRLACDNGEMRACTSVGWSYAEGEGVAKDKAEALRFFTKGCEGEHGYGCASLAEVEEGEPGEEVPLMDPLRVKASALYKKGCELGSTFACTRYGYRLHKGEGVAQNDASARRYYAMSCDDDDEAACYNLGVMYEHQQGVGKDLVKSATYYDKSCTLGHMSGCAAIGNFYAAGEGVDKNGAKAAERLTKACDGDIGWGCTTLGWLYVDGEIVSEDMERAHKYLLRGCDLKDADGCLYAAATTLDVAETDKVKTAQALLDRAKALDADKDAVKRIADLIDKYRKNGGQAPREKSLRDKVFGDH